MTIFNILYTIRSENIKIFALLEMLRHIYRIYLDSLKISGSKELLIKFCW